MRSGLLALAVVWLAACGGEPSGPPPPPPPPPPPGPPVASDPVIATPVGSSSTASVMAPTADEDVVYVTLPPGSAPEGRVATLINLRTNDSVVVAVGEGGFDPTAIPAIAGDQIAIIVRDGGGNVVFAAPPLVVTPRRPPVVVRTNPPPRKRDVPLNARITVVFSEPIDSASLTSAAIRLRLGSQLVAGQLAFRDSLKVAALFIPNQPLLPGETYTLEITQQIRDLDGDMLDSAVSVEFTTASSGAYEEFFVDAALPLTGGHVGDSVVIDYNVRVLTGEGDGVEGAVLRIRVSTGRVVRDTVTSGLGGLTSGRWAFAGIIGVLPADSTAELSACASNSATRCDQYWPILLIGYRPR